MVRRGDGRGFLGIAVLCARDFPVEPATVIRAARDFAVEEPGFTAEIGLVALRRLLDGTGYDPAVSLVRDEELSVEEVEGLGASTGEDAQALVAGTPTEGNRRQAEVLRDGTRRRHEVPDDPHINQGLARAPTRNSPCSF